MRRDIELNGEFHQVSIVHRNNIATLRIGEHEHETVLHRVADGEYRLTLDGNSHRVWLASHGEAVFVHAFGRGWELELIDPIEGTGGQGGAGSNLVLAPMPGMVVAVHVNPGDAVHDGQALMTIESMKLQTAIDAWRGGTVEAVHLSEGDTFERGAALVSLADEDD